MINRQLFMLFFLGLGLVSCTKFVDIEPPPTKAESFKIFENESSALSAAVGLYSKFLSGNLNVISGGTALYTALSSDELANTSPNLVNDAFRTNSLLPTTSNYALNFWNAPYGFIYHANSVMEGLQASANITDSFKHQLTGEMLVSRALLYFYLVNLFGDVPLITNTDYRVNATLPRTNKMLVYDRLIEDLKIADSLLKVDYPSANRFRPNKFTATALLARIYLYTERYALAEASASSIINSGKYSMVNLANVFSGASSNETIWSLMRDNGNTNEGGTFIPPTTTSRPIYQLTPQLVGAFEANDQRKLTTSSGWLGKNTVSGVDYYYPNKYKQRTLSTGSTPTEFLVVFRLAEQYLIRAEARLNLGNLAGAIQDLTIIRMRAGLTALPLSLTPAQLKMALQQERRSELFCEWGHRWLDLKRTGEATNILGPLKGASWQTTDEMYPLPSAELLYNPFLVQNPGY